MFGPSPGVDALALVFALLTFADQPAQDRSAPWDIVAVVLAGGGCTAAFFDAALLQAGGPGPGSLTLLLAGVTMIVALVVHQHRSGHPLMPVRQLATTRFTPLLAIGGLGCSPSRRRCSPALPPVAGCS